MRGLRFLAGAALLLWLTGCASKDPLDYLPQGSAYVGVNVKNASGQAGMKRLGELLLRVDPATRSTPTIETLYTVIRDPADGGGVYTAIVGAGCSEQLMRQLRESGRATAATVAGRSAYRVKTAAAAPQGGDIIFVKLSENAVLTASDDKGVEAMLATARKKIPGARGTGEFTKLQQLLQGHALAVVANASRYVSALGPSVAAGLSQVNPKAAHTLGQVNVVSLTGDWDQELRAEFTAYLAEPAAAQDLAALVNLLLGLQRNALPPVARQLAARATPEGVAVVLEVPREEADAWLSKLEKLVESLPADPQRRALAFSLGFPTLFR